MSTNDRGISLQEALLLSQERKLAAFSKMLEALKGELEHVLLDLQSKGNREWYYSSLRRRESSLVDAIALAEEAL